MKRYPVSMARERMADVLDEVERSGAALIERGDVQYVITVKRASRRRARKPGIEVMDPAVASGQWGWEWTPEGAQFRSASRRRR